MFAFGQNHVHLLKKALIESFVDNGIICLHNNVNNYVLCILEAAFLRFFVVDIFEVLKLKKIYFNLTKTRLIM
jgi:hypothetical protein